MNITRTEVDKVLYRVERGMGGAFEAQVLRGWIEDEAQRHEKDEDSVAFDQLELRQWIKGEWQRHNVTLAPNEPNGWYPNFPGSGTTNMPVGYLHDRIESSNRPPTIAMENT